MAKTIITTFRLFPGEPMPTIGREDWLENRQGVRVRAKIVAVDRVKLDPYTSLRFGSVTRGVRLTWEPTRD